MSAEVFAQWGHIVLEWIGFGTVIGLLAKAIMPGRDPGGALTTLLLGIGGVVIGSGVLMFFTPEQKVTPLSPLGFVVGVAGAFILLGFYRLMSGRIPLDDMQVPLPRTTTTRTTRKRAAPRTIVTDL